MFILNAIMMFLAMIFTSGAPLWVRIVAIALFAILAVIGNEWYRFTLTNVDISIGFIYGEIQKIKKHLKMPLDNELNNAVGWEDTDNSEENESELPKD